MIHHSTVRTRAPLRVSFAGGGTDLPEFSDRFGGAVLSATIKRYAHVTATYNGELEMKLACDCPPGSGLGGSSAVMVAWLKAMDARMGIERSRHDLAEAAYFAERVYLRVAGGKQDQYAAAFGGINLIEFPSKKEEAHEHTPTPTLAKEVIQVSPVVLTDQARLALQRSLVLVHTGRARTDAGIQVGLAERCSKLDWDTVEDLKNIYVLVDMMHHCLERADLESFGQCLSKAWERKKRSSPCTTPRADELYDAARKAGAWGGKLCGAGLGGYLLLCCSEDHYRSVRDAVEWLDARCETVEFEDEGAKVIE